MKFVFILPLILSLIWFAYLRANNYTLEQGKQGFLYIAVISSVFLVFFTVVSFLV